LYRRDRADADFARRFERGAAIAEPREQREDLFGERERFAARVVQRRGAAGAVEQRIAEARFEPLHLRADGRLREADLFARRGERTVPRNGDEGREFAEHAFQFINIIGAESEIISLSNNFVCK
jgi:hypothetical protein